MVEVAKYNFFSIGPGEIEGRFVVRARNGDLLGTIERYGPWNKWCLFPSPGTVWSECCLRDASQFLRLLGEGKIETTK